MTTKTHSPMVEKLDRDDAAVIVVGQAAELLRADLEDAGITREELMALEEEARRRTFVAIYPELAELVNHK